MSELIKQHLTRISNLGVRITRQRLAILNALLECPKPKSAYMLKDKLDEKGYNLNISTIYRILEFWIENNVVHKLTSNNTFLVCADKHADHVHVLQHCLDCGEIKEQCSASLQFEFPKTNEFLPNKSQVIELLGECLRCKGRRKYQ